MSDLTTARYLMYAVHRLVLKIIVVAISGACCQSTCCVRSMNTFTRNSAIHHHQWNSPSAKVFFRGGGESASVV